VKLHQVIGARTITVVVALAALELGLRQFGWGQRTVNQQSERFGWRMLGDQSAWSANREVPENTNSWGFRDRDWPAPRQDADGHWVKDPSVFRVAVVGNSLTFGTSVPEADVWTRALEDRLRADFAERGVTLTPVVMNFAVQGYVFEQMARVYEDIASRWRPDVLIVPTHPHDMCPMKAAADDTDADFRELILRSATYDLLLTEVIGRWVPPPLPPKPSEAELLARGPAPQRRQDTGLPPYSVALDDFIREQPFAKANRRFWQAMAERLETVRTQLEAEGGRLMIVTLPRFVDILEPKRLKASSQWIPWTRERPTTLHSEPLPEFRGPMDALMREMLEKAVPGNLTQDLSTLTWKDASGAEHPGDQLDHADESLFLLRDTGHYSPAGHRLVGETVFRDLQAAGWLP
jgi:hypothetical protein